VKPTIGGESVQQRRRPLVTAAGFAIAAVVVAIIAHARGGGAYELRFGTAFSDGEALALIAAAVLAAALMAGVRWAAALLLAFGLLVVVLGVMHPCRIAFQDSPHPDRCTVSATAAALGLYAALAALLCAAARGLVARLAPSATTAALAAGAGACVVPISLFAPWYRATDDGHDFTQTGWQAFAGFDDVGLVVLAAVAVALLVAMLRARRRAAAGLGTLVSLLALSGAGLVFYRLFTAADPPSPGYAPTWGAFVGLGALAALAFAGMAATESVARDG
jgi:hypothetical protein